MSIASTPMHQPPSSIGKAVGLALAAALLVGVVLLAFAWPSVTADPKDVPVGIVGAEAQIDQVGKAVDEQADGALKLERFDDRDAAVTAIEERRVYGAILLPDPAKAAIDPAAAVPELLVASASNSAVTQLLTGLGNGMHAKVTDVVPLADTDPRGAGLAAAALPLVMGGMLGAVLISTAVHGNRRRFLSLVVYGVVAGAGLAAILQFAFGALQGNYLLNASAIGLSVLAISATLVGLRSLIGMPGLGLGAAVMFLLANPLSGATMPVEFLLAPWGAIGQWFPPGAGATLVRTLSYFPDAPTAFQWLVLGGWMLLGVALIGVAALRRHAEPSAGRGGAGTPAPVSPEPAPALSAAATAE